MCMSTVWCDLALLFPFLIYLILLLEPRIPLLCETRDPVRRDREGGEGERGN